MLTEITFFVLFQLLNVIYFPLTQEGGGITYNPETEEFEVKYGKKVRMPKPITPQEPELHKPEPELHRPEIVNIKTPTKDIHVHKHEEL